MRAFVAALPPDCTFFWKRAPAGNIPAIMTRDDYWFIVLIDQLYKLIIAESIIMNIMDMNDISIFYKIAQLPMITWKQILSDKVIT